MKKKTEYELDEVKGMGFLSNSIKWQVIFAVILSFFVGGLLIFFILGEGRESEEEEWILPWEEVKEEKSDSLQASSMEKIFVDIKGEVIYPGIYEIEEGGRVFQAIDKAGGFTELAEERVINLAEKCYDEMVIYVPSKEEFEGGGMINYSQSSNSQDDRIRINQATPMELTKLPGIGPAKAEAIIRYREENGPFRNVEELVNVPGIGEKTLENIKDLIKVH
ncbi:competence protein ComEA [Evansella vedderi]|uniref:Competence protein ComEA n=1 Tax=Evansella vedderi TaxID=38282 RepID=A0ABT9ZT07_9BACI|nr:helix-hairpin-helix domain-containing protein [Evansella vedderi]MDQ0254329.1 competence protein ComEA [Evansella vedderi]